MKRVIVAAAMVCSTLATFSASAQVKQAEAALNQRDVDVTELSILAPTQGQITARVANLGENFSPGAPLFSLIDLGDLWFTFNIRDGEDIIRDPEVYRFPTAAAARATAVKALREMLRTCHDTDVFDAKQIEIADETGHPVSVVNCYDVMPIRYH